MVVESKQPGNTHRLIHNYLTCFFSECYLTEVNLAGPLSGLVKWSWREDVRETGSEGGCGRGTTESVDASGER